MKVKWIVSFHDEFNKEFDTLSEAAQDEMLAHARLLEQFGPQLARPRVDTLIRIPSRANEGAEIQRR